MSSIARRPSLILLAFSLAGLLAACNRAPSASAQPPSTAVHGEPINGTNTTAIAVATALPAKTAGAPSTDYLPLGFDKLASYNFEVPDDVPLTNQTAGVDKANDQIPATVKALNLKRVSVKGFMLPLKVDGGSVTEFLLMKDQSMCCYGNVPKITEWINVKAGKGLKAIMDQPVSIEGTLRVGAMRENGYLVGIYQMDGEKMVEPSGN